MQNSKNDSHCLAITTRCGKDTFDPPMPVVDKVWDDVANIDDELKEELEKLVTSGKSSQKLMGVDRSL